MLVATLMAEYHYTFERAIAEDYCRALALISALCERNGMIGISTYRTHEFMDWVKKSAKDNPNAKVFAIRN